MGDVVRAFLDDIGPVKATTLEEEIACARVIQSEPPEDPQAHKAWERAREMALERLVIGNIGFFRRMVRRWAHPSQDTYPDVLQMALEGATIAALRYKPQELQAGVEVLKRTGRFISYARHWVMQRVLNDILDNRGVSIPASMRTHLKLYREFTARYFEDHGREASSKQIMKRLNIDAATYNHLMSFLNEPVSLHQQLDYYDDLVLEQAIGDEGEIAERTEQIAQHQMVWKALMSVPPRHRRMTGLRYGLFLHPETGESMNEMPVEEIAEEYGLVRQQVSGKIEQAYALMRSTFAPQE